MKMKKYGRNTNVVSNSSNGVLETIRIIIEDVVTEKLSQQISSQTISHLLEKALLKATDVCEIFQASKPTLYT